MYNRSFTSIRTMEEETIELPITMGFHHGSSLSMYLFALFIDELTRHIQNDIRWCMFFY